LPELVIIIPSDVSTSPLSPESRSVPEAAAPSSNSAVPRGISMRRERRLVRGGVFGSGLIVFAACFFLTGGHIYSPDEEILFRLTEALAARGEWHIAPLEGFATREGRGGVEYPQYPPLQAIAAIPFYGLARLTRPLISDEAILRRAWETTQYHDGSADAYWNRFWVAVGFNPLVTAATAGLLWFLTWILTGRDRRAAWILALGYGLSTLALPHGRTFFTEPLAALLVMLSLAALLVWSRDTNGHFDSGWAALCGGAAALGIWTRVDFVLFLPGLAVGVAALSARGALERTQQGRRRMHWRKVAWKPLFMFALPIGAALIGWLLYNNWRFGGLTETGYEDQPEGVRFATPLFVGLHGFLCTPGKGLFFFSPLLLVAVFGWVRLLRREPIWGWALTLSGGVFFVAMCKWQNWAGGWCWGPRHIFQIHAMLMLGLAPLLVAPRRTAVRVLVAVGFVVGLAVQVLGSSQSFIDFYHLFYRNPTQPPTFYSLYDPSEQALLDQLYEIRLRGAPAGMPPIPAQYLPAPINDSVYIPQNSQWRAYPAMARMGLHDFFWLHLLTSR
jgi:hypothetical protein